MAPTKSSDKKDDDQQKTGLKKDGPDNIIPEAMGMVKFLQAGRFSTEIICSVETHISILAQPEGRTLLNHGSTCKHSCQVSILALSTLAQPEGRALPYPFQAGFYRGAALEKT